MDALEALKKRRSVRVFQDKPVSRQDLEAVIDAGRFAPTARNVQPWKFVAVTDKEVLNKISRLADNGRFISECGACIAIFCSDTKYYLEDGCAATVNILNAATALGLASCWVAGDKKPYCADISRLLGAGPECKLVSLVALGYSQDKDCFKLTDKKPLKELLFWEKF